MCTMHSAARCVDIVRQIRSSEHTQEQEETNQKSPIPDPHSHPGSDYSGMAINDLYQHRGQDVERQTRRMPNIPTHPHTSHLPHLVHKQELVHLVQCEAGARVH